MRPDGAPLAVVAKVKNALRVVATDPLAEVGGIRIGQSLADARGALPELAVAEADAGADLGLLERIADWCDRYTPLVALDPPQGLFLDVTGCAHLFAQHDDDGEAALLADCLDRLARQGFAAVAAIASTAGAAWAVARYGGHGIVPPGAEKEAIADLPVAALRIAYAQEQLLDRLGLKRIGQLIGKPRAPFAARFGSDLVRRLDQALGAEDEVLSPRRPAPLLSAERRFAEPVIDEASLLDSVRSLAGTLAVALERRDVGARLIEASFFRIDGEVFRVSIGTASPLRAPDTLAMLFSERLATLGSAWDAGFGFETVRLAVLEDGPLAAAQIDFSGAGAEGDDLAGLVDRLAARLGPSRITRYVPVDTHVPERAVLARPFACAPAEPWTAEQDGIETPPDRPLRLFARPEPVEVMAEVPEGHPLRFRWRRVVHEVARAEGPERIAPEWWQPEDHERATRDYYRVEDAEGRRYWLYREGLYGRETASPAWYVHGLFA